MPEETIPTGSTEAAALQALIDILRTANTQEAWEAQTILLRRLALQGDVVNSRVPPPRNITEIGGYLNLLETTQQPEMRAQTLAGILGVAGPNPPLGWTRVSPPLSMIQVANDRPEGTAQPAIPLHFSVRSDFQPAVVAAIATLHERGCVLPLQGSQFALPPASPGVVVPDDMLAYIGRVLSVVPASALVDPATDPIALARLQVTGQQFEVMARVLTPGTVAVATDDYEAIQCDASSCTAIAMANSLYVPLTPILGAAGFYPLSSASDPSTSLDTSWSRFQNVTGLVAGVSTLGDELRLLFDAATISGSVFNTRLAWVWDGLQFSPL
nr:hypothetical protein [Nitrosomonas nitrosa]